MKEINIKCKNCAVKYTYNKKDIKKEIKEVKKWLDAETNSSFGRHVLYEIYTQLKKEVEGEK